LYYYRARYYDPNTGRFTQKDPLRDTWNTGENLYVYVGNNPVNRVDPSGLGFFGRMKTVQYGGWFTFTIHIYWWPDAPENTEWCTRMKLRCTCFGAVCVPYTFWETQSTSICKKYYPTSRIGYIPGEQGPD